MPSNEMMIAIDQIITGVWGHKVLVVLAITALLVTVWRLSQAQNKIEILELEVQRLRVVLPVSYLDYLKEEAPAEPPSPNP